jgi:hypothetical protein
VGSSFLINVEVGLKINLYLRIVQDGGQDIMLKFFKKTLPLFCLIWRANTMLTIGTVRLKMAAERNVKDGYMYGKKCNVRLVWYNG